MNSQPCFVVTAWRDSQELLQLRHDLYSPETARRQNGVSKVFAWRLRKPDGLPLLPESTADIVDVILQDDRAELKHNALRLLYATAISRFITGLADTQIELTRDRPSWFPPGKSLQLPLALLEIRHRIVHRHLPSLAELKRAAKQSLEWLWEWYWSQLNHAFSVPQITDDEVESTEDIKDRLQSLLKAYVKERKRAIKTRKTGLNAASNATSTYTLRFSTSTTATPPACIRDIMLDILIDSAMMLPADKKLGSTMSGAFLIWTPFLVAFCSPPTPLVSLSILLAHLMRAMNAPSRSRALVHLQLDPVREGLHDWILHILSSRDFAAVRGDGEKRVAEHVLEQCFEAPTRWNVRLAESILTHMEWRGKEVWRAVLDAVKEGGVMEGVPAADEAAMDIDTKGPVEVDVDVDIDGVDSEAITKDTQHPSRSQHELMPPGPQTKGPQKVLGMWKPRPIGWLPAHVEDDE